MKLSEAIDDVVDHIMEPKQILKITKCDWDERIDLSVEALTVAPGCKNPLIAQLCKPNPTYDIRQGLLVIDKGRTRRDLKGTVVNKIINDVKNFLETMNVGPRTKVSKWFQIQKYNIMEDVHAADDLYQVWSYMKADNPGNKATHDKNVVGLLGAIMNKYKDRF